MKKKIYLSITKFSSSSSIISPTSLTVSVGTGTGFLKKYFFLSA
jgi:hypothetical protein